MKIALPDRQGAKRLTTLGRGVRTDSSFGSASMLAWLVHNRGIELHFAVFGKSQRKDAYLHSAGRASPTILPVIVSSARWVRRMNPRLPILLVTGYSVVVEEAVAEGFTLVHKPFRLADLARALESLLLSSPRQPLPIAGAGIPKVELTIGRQKGRGRPRALIAMRNLVVED